MDCPHTALCSDMEYQPIAFNPRQLSSWPSNDLEDQNGVQFPPIVISSDVLHPSQTPDSCVFVEYFEYWWTVEDAACDYIDVCVNLSTNTFLVWRSMGGCPNTDLMQKHAQEAQATLEIHINIYVPHVFLKSAWLSRNRCMLDLESVNILTELPRVACDVVYQTLCSRQTTEGRCCSCYICRETFMVSNMQLNVFYPKTLTQPNNRRSNRFIYRRMLLWLRIAYTNTKHPRSDQNNHCSLCCDRTFTTC